MKLHIVMYDEQVLNTEFCFQVAMIQINSPEKFLMTIHGFIENMADCNELIFKSEIL